MKIQEVFEMLLGLELVRSQMEFSRIWLGRSPRYYSSLLARQQQPGLGTLTGLLFRLRNILDHTSEVEARATIVAMVQRLQSYMLLRSISGRAARRVHFKALEIKKHYSRTNGHR